ncbi:MAG: hypothetical protein WEB53_17530 [Akkermansiaceae bacterium]
MTGWRALLVLGASLTGALAVVEEVKFPVWNGDERGALESAGWIAGSLLLTGDPLPDEPTLEPAAELAVEQPTADEIAGDENPWPEIPEEFLPAYFAQRPEGFLVDPQKLLAPADYRDRLNFLNYHASDSSIDLFVYVMGGDQEIPSEVREEEMIERFFLEGRPAAIVFYHLGAPQRSVVYLSPSLTDVVSAAEQRRAVASSVMQAFEKLNPTAQMEAFLVQMSIRIYWMERMIAGGTEASDSMPLTDLRMMNETSENNGAASARFRWLIDLVVPYTMPAGVMLGGVLAVFGINFWLRRRARYHFPDFEVEPRLGGAHAAGVGAVISFASASVPPASQRDQVPDYLRRA